MSVSYDDGTTGTITPTYTDGIITSIMVNGAPQSITYDANGYLTKIGNSAVSGMNNYPESSSQENGSPLHPYGFELGQTTVEFFSITESE